MGLPITYSSGLSAIWRTIFLLAGGLILIVMVFPEIIAIDRWLPALSPGFAQSNIVFYAGSFCVVALLMLGVFGQKDTWTIGMDGLTRVRSGWSGRRTRHYDFADIASVTAQETAADDNSAYYMLCVRLKSGRTMTFRFGDSWQEVWQAKCEIEDAIGVTPA